MWSISDMKSKAWAKLKLYYGAAFVVTLISSLLGGGAGQGGGAGTLREYKDDFYYTLSGMNPASLYMLFITVFGILAVVGVIAILFKIFIGNPILVGKNRFFMESRQLLGSAGIGKVFWVFSCGHYLNVVKIMFLKDLFTFLWTLLLVIPGIYKGYEYAMIPYILSENPEADSRDVFAITKDMMEGNRFQLFLLELSFIGWYLLGLLLCCVGGVLVVPYEEAAVAELYNYLRGNIQGFPFNGFGVEGARDHYDDQNYGSPNYGNGGDNRDNSGYGNNNSGDYYDDSF